MLIKQTIPKRTLEKIPVQRNLYELMKLGGLYENPREGFCCNVYNLDQDSKKRKKVNKFLIISVTLDGLVQKLVQEGYVPGLDDGYSTIGIPKDLGRFKLTPSMKFDEFYKKFKKQFELSWR